jgi:signal transduction histidine kinase
MKFKINIHYLYLFLIYLAFGIFVRTLFRDQIAVGSIWQPIIFGSIILIIVFSYESLLKVIQQITGGYGSNEINTFSKVLELNKKIQHHLEADRVLELVETELKELLHAEKITIFINDNIETDDFSLETVKPLTKTVNQMRLWKGDAKNFHLDEKVINEIINLNKIFTVNDSLIKNKDIFVKSNANIAIPVVYNRQLLCLILASPSIKAPTYNTNQIKVLDYLANQLAVILDRIRIYQQVMLQTTMDHAEKLQVMQSICSNIAHEMRTPLSGIRSSISGVDEYLPELIKAYELSRETNAQDSSSIRKDHLSRLSSTSDRITLMIDQANTVIDMLLMNLREKSLDENQMNICFAKDCIEQAIERYPFRSDEKDKVELELSEDFKFLGIESMFIYVIFNLLKNALYSLRSAQKGKIYISIETGIKTSLLPAEDSVNLISFRDTGEGAEEEVINKMFDSFYTTKEGGTGAGLAYCKRTIESFNGKIECESIVGEYCEFRIYFPEVKVFS